MKKTYYLFRVGQSYACKNKLEKAVLEYITSLDRILIDADRKSDFQKHIKTCIDLINTDPSHKRCKPIEIEWFKSNRINGENNCTLLFRGTGICNAYLDVAFYTPISISF